MGTDAGSGSGPSKRAAKRKAQKQRKLQLKAQEQLILDQLQQHSAGDESRQQQQLSKAESSAQPAGDELLVRTEADPLAEVSADDPLAQFQQILAKFAGAEELAQAHRLSKRSVREELEQEAAGAQAAGGSPAQQLDPFAEATAASTVSNAVRATEDEDGSDSDDGGLDGLEGAHDDDDAGDGQGGKKLSRKQLKERRQLLLERLKQLVPRPEVVELHDASSPDPATLVRLKSYRNTVPVPSHWCQKRKYLQNKRGHEMVVWELPKFIADTGIAVSRTAQQERQAQMTMKQKQRAAMRPRAAGNDIDYQVLYDAFFRHQTKPPLTEHGDLYYEGKENEPVKPKEAAPGVLSPELRAALGMRSETSPVPWLPQMQRWGPPPSFPHLRVPGVNAPIPVGARWGNGPDEWGKPPVDMYGQPLFGGDVFGALQQEGEGEAFEEDAGPEELWGQILMESDGDSEDEDEDESEAEGSGADTGGAGMSDEDGSEDEAEVFASGTRSTLAGIETPDVVQLRKLGDGTVTPDIRLHKHLPSAVPSTAATASSTASGVAPQLYTVLEEKDVSVGDGLFGTTRAYVLPHQQQQQQQPPQRAQEEPGTQQGWSAESQRRSGREEVAINLTPEELANLDEDTLKRKYHAMVAAQRLAGGYQQGAVAQAQERAAKKAKLADDQKNLLKKMF